MRLNKNRFIYFLCTLVCVLQIQFSFGQDKFVLNGNVKDQATGEALIRAVLRIEELPSLGVLSNEYGFYAISLPKGKYTLIVSQLGYEKYKEKVLLDSHLNLTILLTPANTLKEVVVESGRKNDNLLKAQMGTETLNLNAISKVPVIFGEKDILKTLQLLPGVKSAGEGNSGFYVRGGSADQNLILLDEAPVYNASHLLGILALLIVMR